MYCNGLKEIIFFLTTGKDVRGKKNNCAEKNFKNFRKPRAIFCNRLLERLFPSFFLDPFSSICYFTVKFYKLFSVLTSIFSLNRNKGMKIKKVLKIHYFRFRFAQQKSSSKYKTFIFFL